MPKAFLYTVLIHTEFFPEMLIFLVIYTDFVSEHSSRSDILFHSRRQKFRQTTMSFFFPPGYTLNPGIYGIFWMSILILSCYNSCFSCFFFNAIKSIDRKMVLAIIFRIWTQFTPWYVNYLRVMAEFLFCPNQNHEQ